MPEVLPPVPSSHADEQDLFDLPPLDDDDDRGGAADSEDLAVEDEGPVGPDGTLTGEAGAVDDDIDEAPDAPNAKGGEPDERDVDTGPDDEGLAAMDERAHPDDEATDDAHGAGDTLDDSAEPLDDGAEGTSELAEDALDEVLPELDDDDESQGIDVGANLILDGEAGLPPLAKARYGIVDDAGVTLPCRVVAAYGGIVAAAGEMLLVVDEAGATARALPFAEKIVAVAISDEALFAATARGEILTRRGAAKLAALPGAARGAVVAASVELAATSGRLWIRSDAWLSQVVAPAQAAPLVRERVLAIAASGGTLLSVTQTNDGPSIELRRGDDEGSRQIPLTGKARALVDRARDPICFAADQEGRSIALASGDQLVVSRDGGETFASIEAGMVYALAFGGEGAGALLALVARDGLGSAYVVACSASGEPERIGEIPGVELAYGAGIVWDASRGLIWAATSAGLFALGRPTRH